MSETNHNDSPQKEESSWGIFDAQKNQQKKKDFNERYGSDFVSNPTLTSEEPKN